MKIAVSATVALVAGIITPGLLFYFDVTPKVVLLLAAVIAILLFSAPARWEDVKNLCRSRAGLYLTLFLAFSLLWLSLATVFSTNPHLSLNGSVWRRLGLDTYAGILLFCLVSTAWLARDPDRTRMFLRVLSAAGSVLSIYGICQYFGFDPLQPSSLYQAGEGPFTIVRPPGTLGHADYFATWLVPIFFLSLAAARNATHRWESVALYLASTLSVAAVVLSGTRGALLGIAVGTLLLGARLSRKGIAVGLAALALAGVFVISPAGAKLRARAHWSFEDPFGGARLLLWRDTFRMGLERPFLGYGPDTFTTAFPQHQSRELARAYPDFYHESPHNIFLDALIAGGLPCVAALAGCIGVALYAARRHPAPSFLPALVGMLVAQQFCVFVAATALLFYGLLGLVLASVSAPRPPASKGQDAPLSAFAVAIPLSVALGAYLIPLAINDWDLARMRDRFTAADVAGAMRWNHNGQADLYYSREMFRLARLAPKLGVRVLAMQQALDSGTRATVTAEDRQNAWYQMAMLHASQNNPASVERDLRQAIACAPNWFKPHWALAQLLARTNRPTEAVEEARAAVDRDGNQDSDVQLTLTKLLHITNPPK